MNILFLTLSRISDISQKGIYTDLAREFVRNGHSLYIVTPTERKHNLPTSVIENLGAKILRVKTLNIQKTNIIEKALGTLLLPYQFMTAIRKYCCNIKFDLVLYSTPPITLNKVVLNIKKCDDAKSYLMLKDIFPQNAVDLEMFSKRSFVYRKFRQQERILYDISDYIGCMSPANIEYVSKHNLNVTKKLELCPNCIDINYIKQNFNREETLSELGIPTNKILFIYGGNIGKPQGIDFLLEVVSANESNRESHIIIVGSGTEYHKVAKWFAYNKPKNSSLIKYLQQEKYDQLVRSCDVGMIFLDHRFTIPNYPSRLLSYLENKMPIIAATDTNTDVGKIAQENGYGYWAESGDINGFMKYFNELANNADSRKRMGRNGYKYLSENYTANKVYQTIVSHFNI